MHGLTSGGAAVAIGHHDAIDAVELNLVLLVQSVEVEAALAVRPDSRVLHLRRGRVLLELGERLMCARHLRMVLSTDLASGERGRLRHSLHCCVRIRVTRARLRLGDL